VIKDVVKHAHLVSIALYYSQVLYHLLYLIINLYIITIFVVLLTNVEAADKATSSAQHPPDQETTTLTEG
jgi:hypothetical protein